MEDAEKYFTAATAAAKQVSEANYNLGVINIQKGEYATANKYFGSSKSFNAALAQLLSGNAAGAKSTLDGVKNSDYAAVYYLKAVIAARSANEAEVFSNLKQAVAKDSSLKDYAKKDLEFGKYFEKDGFKSIVK